jgi:hypothetical protein
MGSPVPHTRPGHTQTSMPAMNLPRKLERSAPASDHVVKLSFGHAIFFPLLCPKLESRRMAITLTSLSNMSATRLARSSHLPDVVASTLGLVFFGTPHLGADPRSLVHKTAEGIARLALRVNDNVVRTLRPNSENARRLQDEFIPLVQRQK